MRKTWIQMGMIALVLTASLGLTGCGFFGSIGGAFGDLFTPNRANDYGEAHLRFDGGAIRYDGRHSKIIDETDTRREGVVTDLQWLEFKAFEGIVIASAEAVIKDFEEWEKTGTKPAGFQAHEKTLNDAREKFIVFVDKVRP